MLETHGKVGIGVNAAKKPRLVSAVEQSYQSNIHGCEKGSAAGGERRP